MDLALTYRCNNDCAHCYNARPRNSPELTTAEWKKILDRLWELGIPHVVFTGGEPTLRERPARADRPRRAQRADHRAEHQRPPAERSALTCSSWWRPGWTMCRSRSNRMIRPSTIAMVQRQRRLEADHRRAFATPWTARCS